MRCFIALRVPDAARRRVEEIQEALRRADADVRWVAPEALHLTLKFLGEIGEDAVRDLSASLEEIGRRVRGFGLAYRGVGTFLRRGKPGVIWIGCTGDVDRLSALAKEAERAAEASGIPREDRPFRPHLTIGRTRSSRGARELRAALEMQRDADAGGEEVTEFELIQSTLTAQAPIYVTLARFSLGC